MRRRWIWLGGLALLGVAFLSLVVLRRLLVEPLKAGGQSPSGRCAQRHRGGICGIWAGGGLGLGAPGLARGRGDCGGVLYPGRRQHVGTGAVTERHWVSVLIVRGKTTL